MIRFFNTLSGEKETFEPLAKGEVGIYTCGPTVYDYAHIGNFRAFVFEDLLRRFLSCSGYRVRHVMNITDVDDKTIAASAKTGRSLNEFTQTYIRAFEEDLATLHILPANHPAEWPRATREIPAMLQLISDLLRKGIAYEKDGSVYFRVAAFPGYGRLSKKKLDLNRAGARVDYDDYDKESASDFVMWKAAKAGEPSWDSPWGKGRPGWHIECSAMSMKYLGATFDIHAGGEDLIFPHHENEIAQSEASTGRPFVRYWLHCRFLLVNGEKMSKSKGNFFTLRDLLRQKADPLAVRYALLSTHYRTPLNFSQDGLKEAAASIKRLDDCYFRWLSAEAECEEGGDPMLVSSLKEAWGKIMVALEDDLNISQALAVLWETVTGMNRVRDEGGFSLADRQAVLEFFKQADTLFGFDIALDESVPEGLLAALQKRNAIRAEERFRRDAQLQSASDRLRDEISGQGWLVQDGRPGQPSVLKKKRRIWD